MVCHPDLCTCCFRDVAEFAHEKLLYCQEISVICCVLSKRQIEVCFSHDVILCGWLGSKYQLTNSVNAEVRICMAVFCWTYWRDKCVCESNNWVVSHATSYWILLHCHHFFPSVFDSLNTQRKCSYENLFFVFFCCFVFSILAFMYQINLLLFLLLNALLWILCVNLSNSLKLNSEFGC